MIHHKTLYIYLKNVFIGYSHHVLGEGGDIPMHHILYFTFILNNGNKLILWDRKTKLDPLYRSGIIKSEENQNQQKE